MTNTEELLADVRAGRREVRTISHPCTGRARIEVSFADGETEVLYGHAVEELEQIMRELNPSGDDLDSFVRALGV